jgi:four helix bundle protein
MKGENIATRLLVFGAGVVRLCRRLPEDASAKHIARQLVRAATGGGANDEEARGAESCADLIHKVGIANKELREALYWLRPTEEAALVTDGELAALIREANELVAILTASFRTAKQRDVTSCGPSGIGGSSASTCSHGASGISASLVSTRRVDQSRSGPAISSDRIGNREAEPRTARCAVSDRF